MLGVQAGNLCPDQSGDDTFRRAYYDAALAQAYPVKAAVKPSKAVPVKQPVVRRSGGYR